jgi:indole-3-glycerol phosphate synthase
MEVKRRAADGHDLMGTRSIASTVAAYEEAGAPCISVVTGSWFGGDTSMLDEVASLTSLPILQKDFVTRRSQLAEARERGAAAVLLTVSILPSTVVANLIDAAIELGLTPFVEISSAAEVRQVHRARECIVAVNNKEIRDRERGDGRLERSSALLPAIRATGCSCAVSASGIAGPAVAAALLDQGFGGLLVGTAVLRDHRPGEFVAAVVAHRKQHRELVGT